MHAAYSPGADALAFWLGTSKSIGTKELDAGLYIDLDAMGRIVGVEILGASTWIDAGVLSRLPAPKS